MLQMLADKIYFITFARKYKSKKDSYVLDT